MDGGSQGLGRPARPRLHVRRWATVGIVAAGFGLLLLVLSQTSRLTIVISSVLVLFGSLAFVTAMLVGMVRRELRRYASLVADTVERGMIEVLPPGRAAELVLNRVYGTSPYTRNVATALLGGEGDAPDGADLTISEHTEIDYRLTRVDTINYQLVMEARYTFRNRVPTARLVVFATSDATLRDSIVAGCRFPLFELWFIREDETRSLFEESVESMRDSVQVGLQYVDTRGAVRDVPTRHPGPHIHEVRLQKWGRYLSFFGGDDLSGGGIDKQLYMGKLRIFEIDLHALADDRSSVALIQQLTLRSTTLQLVEDGFCWWQAPYPCFVERMGFDTASFDGIEGRPLRFMVKPFTIYSQTAAPSWRTSDEVANVDVHSWMLPGHGMALVWRPADLNPVDQAPPPGVR